ncbi:hypothetical protein FRC08_011047 [Ceratobasidium sp. 394]|nr:hypothetical protein FRC08_011047 [Ceratobasidium sp. 394]
MGQPSHRLPWEENFFNPARQWDGARRRVPPAVSLNAQPSGIVLETSKTLEHHSGETPHAKEQVSPTLAQAMEYLKKFFDPGQRTSPSEKDKDSFELVDIAEVERECCLTEWPHQEPSKDRITVLLRLWGYQIYLPSKVLKSLKEQRLKERAAFISMQLQSQFDCILSIALPGSVRWAMGVLRKPAIPNLEKYVTNCWDKIFAFSGGNGVILRAFWLSPLVYDLKPWMAESPKLEEAQKSGPRVKKPIRATSVDDMVVVG